MKLALLQNGMVVQWGAGEQSCPDQCTRQFDEWG